MEFLTFDDIIAATEATKTIPSIPGKTVKVRALDPIDLMRAIDEMQKVEGDNVDSTAEQFTKIREIVVKGLVQPSLDTETVKRVPGRVLMDLFNAILEHSGAGEESKAEAEVFRSE